MQLRSILLTAIVCAGVWYWIKNRELKDFALRSAAKYCDSLSLRLLDQTVTLSKLRIEKNDRGQRVIVRTYHFDFSADDQDRYKGKIILHGRKVESIQLAPHRIE